MAEYQEVVEHFKRMCNTFPSCSGCPMYPACNVGRCRKLAFELPKEFEGRVMAWAAAHPKPVYPTWDEVFAMEYRKAHGIVPRRDEVLEWAYMTPIPADIAGKLGIEPKEG